MRSSPLSCRLWLRLLSSVAVLLLALPVSCCTQIHARLETRLNFCALQTLVAAQEPKAFHTLMTNLPAKLIYFEDSPVLMYHDAVARNVWRSPDEGKTWSVVDNVPEGEATAVIEHPADTLTSYILTKSTTQWRSKNRGQSWQSFTTPLVPAPATNALAFHATEWNWVIFTGQNCETDGSTWRGRVCYDEAYYTQDAFESAPKKLLDHTSRCVWAHATKEVTKETAKELIFCIAFEPPPAGSSSPIDSVKDWLAGGIKSIRESRLYSSTDFFATDKKFVDLGIGKEARGVVGIGAVQSFIVVALKPSAADDTEGASGSDEMVLYITSDGINWKRAIFPHGHGLKENAYTIVDSTPYSVIVDVLTDPDSASGTLFTSNSEGSIFVVSLEHTNRNEAGIVDFEKLENVDGVAIANVLDNWEDFKGGNSRNDVPRQVKSRITFDDGARWQALRAPGKTHKGADVGCDTNDLVRVDFIACMAKAKRSMLVSNRSSAACTCTASPDHTTTVESSHPQRLASSWLSAASASTSCPTTSARPSCPRTLASHGT